MKLFSYVYLYNCVLCRHVCLVVILRRWFLSTKKGYCMAIRNMCVARLRHLATLRQQRLKGDVVFALQASENEARLTKRF